MDFPVRRPKQVTIEHPDRGHGQGREHGRHRPQLHGRGSHEPLDQGCDPRGEAGFHRGRRRVTGKGKGEIRGTLTEENHQRLRAQPRPGQDPGDQGGAGRCGEGETGGEQGPAGRRPWREPRQRRRDPGRPRALDPDVREHPVREARRGRQAWQ